MAAGSDQEQLEAEAVVSGLNGFPVVISSEADFKNTSWLNRRSIVDKAARSVAGPDVGKLICAGKRLMTLKDDPCNDGAFTYKMEAKPMNEGFDGRPMSGFVAVCPRCGFAIVIP